MRFTHSFYRAAAACSVLSAVTTLLLIFLPPFYAPVEGFEGRMQRVADPAYVLRSWVYLCHPFLVLAAALAVAMRIRHAHSAAAMIGLLGFVLWAFTEAGQQTLTLFAFDRWRVAYLTGDAAVRAHLQANVAMYDGLWDAAYFLLLLGFAVGNLAFGLALLSERGFSTLIGAFLLAAFALTLTNITGELRLFALPEALGFWLYPAVQPLGRMLLGVWLWRAADETLPLPR